MFAMDYKHGKHFHNYREKTAYSVSNVIQATAVKQRKLTKVINYKHMKHVR